MNEGSAYGCVFFPFPVLPDLLHKPDRSHETGIIVHGYFGVPQGEAFVAACELLDRGTIVCLAQSLSSVPHGASPEAMMWHAPGIEIVLPSCASDVKGLIRSALKSDNPTVILGHAKLLGVEEEVADEDYAIPFGAADIKRQGRDITLVATSLMVSRALEAAEALRPQGIEAEVVDPRTLVPLDKQTILASVAKTGRLAVIDEANQSCSAASEIAAMVASEGFADLKGPIIRIARADVPIPFSPILEERLTVTAERIAGAVAAGIAG